MVAEAPCLRSLKAVGGDAGFAAFAWLGLEAKIDPFGLSLAWRRSADAGKCL